MNAALPQMYWRVNCNLEPGYNCVSLLLPTSVAGQAREYPIELLLRTSRKPSAMNIKDLEWSEQDNHLFMSLLSQVMESNKETLEVNMQDEVIQEFVHLVATARFQVPLPAVEYEGDDINAQRFELELGDIVSLNTCHGFISAVITDLDSIDATCVIFDDIIDKEEDEILIEASSSVVISRLCVLHEDFAERQEAGALQSIH